MTSTLFSEALTRFRELAGLTQLQLASRSGAAASSVNRWEKGGLLPKRDNAERLDAALEAHGELMAAWRRSTKGAVLWEWARDFDSIERAAWQLSIVTPSLVPGYLQCPEYARLVFRAGQPLVPPAELEKLVALRCERLTELEELQVTAVFPISAVAGLPDKVRARQVEHLRAWVATDRVILHLVPEGTTLLVPSSPLMIFTLRSGELAVVSDHADGNVVHQPDTHDRITALYTSAMAESLPVTHSLEALGTLS
ncbi:Scr1 family TA system antitoxin-like transcriptional regulator [Nocardiopsis sediminis]|uniref:Scr1 family TA system antitoxin-like transcriptional regulator n=1 Tax=Nocardiopsis sediminis TaxID=1778267 RepID=A0ABV8FIY1_9ACTN